jgi:hypothetical protein
LNIIKCCGKKSCSDVGLKKNSSSSPIQNSKDNLAKKPETSRFPKPPASLTPGHVVLSNIQKKGKDIKVNNSKF